MGILEIKPVQRRGARLMFAFCGPSGSGKTYTALQFAWGLAGGDASKVGMLDAENGRGRLYSDILVGKDGKARPFLHADLYAPFTPRRYGQAILEFQQAGVKVLVIDSVSHEWDGLGGVQDMATDAGGGRIKKNTGEPVQIWTGAKASHRHDFMNVALTCDMDIVFCVRAQEKMEVSPNGSYKSLGLQPVQEKNFMFEMTASLMMSDRGKTQFTIKPPAGDIEPFLCRGNNYITAHDGLAVRKWADGADSGNPHRDEAERARNVIQSQAEQGQVHIRQLWDALSDGAKSVLGDSFLSRVLASASEFEALAKAKQEAAARAVSGTDDDSDDDTDDLNAPVESAPVQAKQPTSAPASQPAPAKPEPEPAAAAELAKPTLPPPVSRRAPAAAQTKPAPPSVEQIEAEIEGAFGDDATGPDGLPW